MPHYPRWHSSIGQVPPHSLPALAPLRWASKIVGPDVSCSLLGVLAGGEERGWREGEGTTEGSK